MSNIRPLEKLISLEEALRICESAAVPTDRTEIASIGITVNRVLAEDVRAEIDVPPFKRSAMDGYAARMEDVKGASDSNPVVLKIVEKIFAGDVSKRSISALECAEIATGGMLPEGADSIVIVEDTRSEGEDQVAILQPPDKGKHIISAGDDIRKGESVVKTGELLTPAKIGAIAAIGRDHIKIYCRPKVVVMPTGDEIIKPGKKIGPGQVYDVNTFTLSSAIKTFGGQVIVKPIVEDSKQSILKAIKKESDADIIIFSGGSSVGEKDLIVDAIKESGELLFHGVAIKPGKPTILGRAGNNLILGMPGHPTSCLSNSYIFLEPMVCKIGRIPTRVLKTVKLKLSEDVNSPKGKAQVLMVKVNGDIAIPVFKESSAITSMTNADGYALIPPDKEYIENGVEIIVKLF